MSKTAASTHEGRFEMRMHPLDISKLNNLAHECNMTRSDVIRRCMDIGGPVLVEAVKRLAGRKDKKVRIK